MTSTLGKDDGIRVEVQELLRFELTQSFLVQFDTSPAGGETGHEDVDVDLDEIWVIDGFVDYFDHLRVYEAKLFNVVVQERAKTGRGQQSFHLTLVPLLSVFSPRNCSTSFWPRTHVGDAFLLSRCQVCSLPSVRSWQ